MCGALGSRPRHAVLGCVRSISWSRSPAEESSFLVRRGGWQVEFGGSSFVKGQQCEVMCDLHMGWMEDEVEGEAGEEAGARSRGEVMREGVLVVGGDGRRGACKMHPCW